MDIYDSLSAGIVAANDYTSTTASAGAYIGQVGGSATFPITVHDSYVIKGSCYNNNYAQQSRDTVVGHVTTNSVFYYLYFGETKITSNNKTPTGLKVIFHSTGEHLLADVNAWLALTEIDYVGAQTTTAANGAYNVRFAAGLKGLDYNSVGYEITRITDSSVGAVDVNGITEVYRSLIGTDAQGNVHVYDPAISGGENAYLSAVVINGVPEGKAVTFLVRPYVLNSANEKIYGNTAVVTLPKPQN